MRAHSRKSGPTARSANGTVTERGQRSVAGVGPAKLLDRSERAGQEKCRPSTRSQGITSVPMSMRSALTADTSRSI